MHACRHADLSRHDRLHIPIARSSKSDLSTMFHTLFPTSWPSDHTNYAIDCTQHALGQSWSQILKLQTAACFFTKRPAYSSLCCHLNNLLKNQIVAGAVPDASTLWSTCSHRPGHSTLATPQDASVDLQYLQASFHRLIQTKQ